MTTVLVLVVALVASLLAVQSGTTAKAEVTNLALGQTATAQYTEAGTAFTPSRMVDGDLGDLNTRTDPAVHNATTASRWSGGASVPQWFQVQLAGKANVSSVIIDWGNTYATAYSISGSVDGVTWTTLASGLAATARGQSVTTPVTANRVRYIRVDTTAKSQQWGLAVWEFRVMGELLAPDPVLGRSLIPLPATVDVVGGAPFLLDPDTTVAASAPFAGLADGFKAAALESTGFELGTASLEGAEIALVQDASVTAEDGYEISANAERVELRASTVEGMRYAVATLHQLLGPWFDFDQTTAGPWEVPAVEIVDEPRFEWRGLMLDPSRSFLTPAEVKHEIDAMARYKLNTLHLHLSDDQGWRIAIRNDGKEAGDPIDYTLLEKRGGDSAVATTNFTDIPGIRGFYTQAEFKAIVAYAKDHGITVVPEIDAPSHSQAALYSIPELNTVGSLPKPDAGQNTAPMNTTTNVGVSTFDVNSEATYTFLRHVERQIKAMNPGVDVFHIGGDEAHVTSAADYRTFMTRALADLAAENLRPIVWHEAAETADLPAGTIVQFWTGSVSQRLKDHLNNNDGKLIYSHVSRAYYSQRPATDVAGATWACGGACTLDWSYNYNPVAEAGATEDKILGVEGATWSEHLRGMTTTEFVTWPRLLALAEVGWTPQAQRSFADFTGRVAGIAPQLTLNDVNFHPAAQVIWGSHVAGALDTSAGGADAVLGYAVAPKRGVTDVSGSVEWADGTTTQVTASLERTYAPGVATSANNRWINSEFVLRAATPLPAGTHTGVLSVTIGGQTQEAPVRLVVTDAPQPTPTATVTVTSTATATASATVTATATTTTTATATATATASANVTATATANTTVTVTARGSSAPTTPAVLDHYTTPGYHTVNGRQWYTQCEPYSRTIRCRTDIWATQTTQVNGAFVNKTGWYFNNLTYLPMMTRAEWGTSYLANAGMHTVAGRQWWTECGTPATGSDACRSYIRASYITSKVDPSGVRTYYWTQGWLLNNIVRFKVG